MITFDIFFEQRDKALSDFKGIKRRGTRNYDVFFFLLKNKYKNPKLELQKFDKDDWNNYLRYSVSTFRKNRKNKFIPILEQVRFKELILHLPDDTDNTGSNTAQWLFKPSGIIVERIGKNKKTVQTHSRYYTNIGKFKLLIPEIFFKNIK